MKIFAVIVTYNGMQWYDRCFSSLQNSVIPVDIIAVDNASSDGTVDYIRKNYPGVILIESKENAGFAKANNIGIKYALDRNADYVFLLNQDAWINQPDTISGLIEQHIKHPKFGILAPLQVYGCSDNIEQEVLLHFARGSRIYGDFISDLYYQRMKDIYDVPYVCAVCWLLPADTIKKIGGFDPLFYHYGEDDNYIQRVKYYGYKIGVCPKVTVSHDIENRTSEYRDKNLDWKKYLLINLGDINNDCDLDKIIKKKFKSVLVQSLRMNRKLLKKTYPEYVYLKKIKAALHNSRVQNKIQQANWL